MSKIKYGDIKSIDDLSGESICIKHHVHPLYMLSIYLCLLICNEGGKSTHQRNLLTKEYHSHCKWTFLYKCHAQETTEAGSVRLMPCLGALWMSLEGVTLYHIQPPSNRHSHPLALEYGKLSLYKTGPYGTHEFILFTLVCVATDFFFKCS